MTFKRILVPIDFSRDSLKALELAVEQFGKQDNTLILTHVVESVSSDVEHDPKTGIRFIDERERKLKALGEAEPGIWREVVIVIVTGKSTDQIIQAARDNAADIVVMGAHGSSGLVEGLFGSTTYSVARKVPCSVMITKWA